MWYYLHWSAGSTPTSSSIEKLPNVMNINNYILFFKGYYGFAEALEFLEKRTDANAIHDDYGQLSWILSRALSAPLTSLPLLR